MDLADQLGIMIINECPSVDTVYVFFLDIVFTNHYNYNYSYLNYRYFTDDLLKNHERALTELINRDKNRPSVIMWSIANEPASEKPLAQNYFK